MKATAVFAVLLAAGIVALAPCGLAEIGFRRAERLFASREFEKGLSTCDAALRWKPAHQGARDLRTKLTRALSSPIYRCGNSSSEGLALALLDQTNRFGEGFLESFDLAEAERVFRLTLELAASASAYVDVSSREERARRGLERIAAMLEDR
ncbi:MAG TPA: hypothetical protein VF950_12085 [Planctomycetota bacterium]